MEMHLALPRVIGPLGVDKPLVLHLEGPEAEDEGVDLGGGEEDVPGDGADVRGGGEGRGAHVGGEDPVVGWGSWGGGAYR